MRMVASKASLYKRSSSWLGFVLPLVLLTACVRFTPPITEPTPTPSPEPEPVPAPGTDPVPGIAYEGEWLVTFTPVEGDAFTHALQVTADVSTEGLDNAGGGLQERCAESCDGAQAGGFGFMGDLVRSDGTAALTLAIFAQTPAAKSTALEVYTVEPITLMTNEAGQATFTAAADWAVQDAEVITGTMTATNVGEARALEGFGLINMGQAVEMLRDAAYY